MASMILAELFDECVLLRNAALDLVAMVPVTGQGSVHVGERDGRILVDDLVR
jgi:hypothetical protein